MESASGNTYMSKRMVGLYKKKKELEEKRKVPQSAMVPKEEKQEVFEEEEANLSMEEVDSDELDNDLNFSDDEEEVRKEKKAKKEAVQMKRRARKPARKFKQEIDTNVFRVNLATLKDQAELASGDPLFCQKCQAIFNMKSKVEEKKTLDGDVEQQWVCEFCNHAQKVELEKEEMPKSDQVNYILEGVAQAKEKQKYQKQDISVIFCLDSSGSMCVSQQVAGKHSIKGDKVTQMNNEFRKFGDGSDQRLQGEKNVTYISRMQCVQAAVDNQLTEMATGAPERKVGLVQFSSEVCIYGDGTKKHTTIAGDKLLNYEYLRDSGTNSANELMQKPISQTQKNLQQKLLQMEENGPTALGPALLSSVAMAAQGAPGSQVVLCTDGLANVGLGAFDEIKTEQQRQQVDAFYDQVGDLARDKGVVVSLISIEGEECNVDTLSRICDVTGGQVERVNPLELTQNFANILSLPVIATNVTLKVKLHKGLEFRNEDPLSLSEDKTILVKELGNVTEETEITFEYRLKPIADLLQMADLNLESISSFPFQAQISYNSLDGNKCVRVITSFTAVSQDREELEKKANYNILSTNAVQQSSKMVKGGQLRGAQSYAKCWNRKMRENVSSEQQLNHYQKFNAHFGGMYNQIQEAYEDEADQEEEEGNVKMKAEGEEEKDQKEKKKSKQKTDMFSANLYKASKNTKKSLQ